MSTVAVDLNNVTSEGRLKTSDVELASSAVPGDLILVHDRLEKVTLLATVHSTDVETGVVVLDVDWRQLDRPELNLIRTTQSADLVLGRLTGDEIHSAAANTQRSSFAITA